MICGYKFAINRIFGGVSPQFLRYNTMKHAFLRNGYVYVQLWNCADRMCIQLNGTVRYDTVLYGTNFQIQTLKKSIFLYVVPMSSTMSPAVPSSFKENAQSSHMYLSMKNVLFSLCLSINFLYRLKICSYKCLRKRQTTNANAQIQCFFFFLFFFSL